ncbi:MAG: hypothetical protein AABY22_26350 [Nanoarchaeota archaeon]
MKNFEDKIKEIKDWEGSKGTPGYRVRYRQLRKELYEMFPQDKMWLLVGDYVLEKSYNPIIDKEFITIFTKQGWDKREEYRREKFGL